MADNTPTGGNKETADDVVAKKLISLGIRLDEREMSKSLDPAINSLQKKLRSLAKESEMNKSGIFGKNGFTDAVKNMTGFDLTLGKSVKTMIAYGRASKELDVDNQKFYNSLNPIEKVMVKITGAFQKKRKAEHDSNKQTQETIKNVSDLDEVLNKTEGLDTALKSASQLESGLGGVGDGALSAAESITEIGPAAEGAGMAVEAFEVVATAGLALIAIAVAGLVSGFYKLLSAAITWRAEVKKFDQLFGGVGSVGIETLVSQMAKLNGHVWGLGVSIEKVNEIVYDATKAGLNFSRAINETMVTNILELSGAVGVASGEITGLYTELLKTTRIGVPSLVRMSDTFIQMNQEIKNTSTLGQVSFGTFKDAILSSADALGIASAKGSEFTDKMIRDLSTLSTLATTLSLSVSGLNRMFDEAGSMLTNSDSKFRTLLAISGGANINQMLSNQFNKTDAILKAVTYVQQLNREFGNNIQITAQVVERSLGISKDVAIKLINMRQSTISDMLKVQKELGSIQTDATREAFEHVNSGIQDQWSRLKQMVTNFFQVAVGKSSGMRTLVTSIENLLTRLRVFMTDSGGLVKLQSVITKVADWIGNNLTRLLNWISEKIDQFSQPGAKNPITALIDTLINTITSAMYGIGRMFAKGALSLLKPSDASIGAALGALVGSFIPGGSVLGGVLGATLSGSRRVVLTMVIIH